MAKRKKEDLSAQLEAINNRRLARRDDYESTNQSFLADIKRTRELKDR